MKPFWQDRGAVFYEGDCRTVMTVLENCSVEAVVCDPPYELGFMGKGWDRSGIAYDVSVWSECLRVLKPGGHLLAFGGSRTYHRLACAIEDAGFEIRDQIQWLYGSGFPKSLDVSKQIDSMEKNAWKNIKELFDRLDHGVIIEWWTKSLNALHCAELVGRRFLKNRVAVGFNTQRSGSVHAHAPQLISQKGLPFSAITAELQCCEVLPLSEVETTSARANAGISTGPSPVRAVSVEQLLQNPSLKPFITASIAQGGVKASQNERATAGLKDEEALKTWLGKKKCLEARDIDALCAGLTDGLKLTILSQSKTFLNLDTQSQMECVSAMIVTTTASTAANLISFTVDTLRDVAIDAAATAERQVIGSKAGLPGYSLTDGQAGGVAMSGNVDGSLRNGAAECAITAPATDAGKQWNGWGTALKPAHEPIVLARKPLIGTVAENVLQHGTGGLNIDGCRIETDEGWSNDVGSDFAGDGGWREVQRSSHALGRWPANVIHDGSDEVLALFPQTDPSRVSMRGTMGESPFSVIDGSGRNPDTNSLRGHNDSGGSAARFFYCAKATQEDRNEGLGSLPLRSAGEVTDRKDGSAGLNSPRAGAGRNNGSRNPHPTVKPTDLMRYLCRLVTPPNGIVLDPFCGSGSTGKAAMLEGLKFIGIELSPEYCELARLRIEAVTKQGQLFTTAD